MQAHGHDPSAPNPTNREPASFVDLWCGRILFSPGLSGAEVVSLVSCIRLSERGKICKRAMARRPNADIRLANWQLPVGRLGFRQPKMAYRLANNMQVD